MGFAFSSAFYIGREVTQAEYRGIQNFYNNQRKTAPLWVGFEPRNWTAKSLKDFLAPIVFTLSLALITAL
jgi:hypothetical protein